MTFLMTLALFLGDTSLTVGQRFPGYKLPDQYGTIHEFAPGRHWIILSWEKKTSEQANAWLKGKPSGFLDQHRIDYLIEISPMPRIIAEKLAKPKMRKYPHRVLIADDAGLRKVYPLQDKKLTVLELKPDATVAAIHFINDMAALEKMVTAP